MKSYVKIHPLNRIFQIYRFPTPTGCWYIFPTNKRWPQESDPRHEVWVGNHGEGEPCMLEASTRWRFRVIFLQESIGIGTPPKTNMTMENQPFQDLYLPLKMVFFLHCPVSFRGGVYGCFQK